jgi:plastocyanin
MKQVPNRISKPMALFAVLTILMAGIAPSAVRAEEWRVAAGAESPNRGSQALAFLPNELWIHTDDSIIWTFPTHERHSISFLKPGQTRPANFGPTFGVLVGCPGTTADGSSFNGSACVSSGVLLLDENTQSTANAPTYSITFPSTGNFKFVCLVHADMTGLVHVLNKSDALPHDHEFYDRQAEREQVRLLAEASGRGDRETAEGQDPAQGNAVAAGIGRIVNTGAGSQTASQMRFSQETIVVRKGDIVEWTSLDPSISHTVSFGMEPTDPRVAINVTPTSDGNAVEAVISSTADQVNSGFLTPAPQDRKTLAQSAPGTTRFRVQFMSEGTFHYICAIHDQLGMKGTVIVRPAHE